MDFPSNSQNIGKKAKAAPAEKEEVQKVVSGEVIQRKKSLGRRLKEVFFGGEFKSATQYISGEVLLPAFKKMIVDATAGGVEKVVYGDTRRRTIEYGFRDPRSRMSYNSIPLKDPRQQPGILPQQPPLALPSRTRQDVGDIILSSRDEASLVLEQLSDIIDKYEVATIADLHASVGLPTNYIDNKWGWYNLHGANVRQTREGFLLDLPPVEPI